jgi:hypothetical protein
MLAHASIDGGSNARGGEHRMEQVTEAAPTSGVLAWRGSVRQDVLEAEAALNGAIVTLRDLRIGARLVGRRDVAHALRRVIEALRSARDEAYGIGEVLGF